ncbi:hypothetical protein [uncultured Thomasclavelia sp.]|uniref:hypothetical protein n=1 Tax=uncultured Thomasclavelia sp. TaxID=3025759 RepID=UPI0025F20428|nr:hypothetical protein [uncultured Thomasclavelia sp.]
MNEIIKEAYSLNVIGYIRVTSKVYKVKCQEGFFSLKFVSNTNLTIVIDHIESLHLKCFVPILRNCHKQILTSYQDKKFYLCPWLKDDNVIIKELKLKFYYECLSYLHSSTFFNYSVPKTYFKEQINEINEIIKERKVYYNELMNHFEILSYRSPAGWMFVLNYYRIEECLNKAQELLEAYQNYVCNLDTIRLCLTYNNFNYDHILMKENCLISIDEIKINLCIYDIYYMYQKIPELIFDFEVILDTYFCKIKLQKEERLLLQCLLQVIPIVKLGNDEVNNIILMSRLLYYLESISSLNRKLSID